MGSMNGTPVSPAATASHENAFAAQVADVAFFRGIDLDGVRAAKSVTVLGAAVYCLWEPEMLTLIAPLKDGAIAQCWDGRGCLLFRSKEGIRAWLSKVCVH